MTISMQFDAVSEDKPGQKWLSRWNRSWPAYRQWFVTNGGENGPSRLECEAALQQYMPELIQIWKTLSQLTGDDDLSARFLSTWCPPTYLGGCSLAALSKNGDTRLVRNYDLSPDLNEGLLLRSAWNDIPAMGMIEFLWGLSDGINQHGLAVALAYGGSTSVAKGFGITTILRYIIETCSDVKEALAALQRIPSHMAYNITLADKSGHTLTVEMKPGGGLQIMKQAIATNHQHDTTLPAKAPFTQTLERLERLSNLLDSSIEPCQLSDEFLTAPLYQQQYADSLGTLFTAEYDPCALSLYLRWQSKQWFQTLDNFQERSQLIIYHSNSIGASPQRPASAPMPAGDWLQSMEAIEPFVADQEGFSNWLAQARQGNTDWTSFASVFTGDKNWH